MTAWAAPGAGRWPWTCRASAPATGSTTPSPILPQLDRFADAALEEFAADGGALVCGNSLGGCVGLRLAERADLGGVLAVAPAGLDMARWLTVVERDRVLRSLLAAPVPIPAPVLRRVVAEVYARLVFHRPAEVSPRIAATFASHFKDRVTTGRMMATARRLIGELRDPFDLEQVSCPVMLVWGRHDAMVFQTGAAASPGRRARVPPGGGRGLRPLPPDRGAGAADGAADGLPGIAGARRLVT